MIIVLAQVILLLARIYLFLKNTYTFPISAQIMGRKDSKLEACTEGAVCTCS